MQQLLTGATGATLLPAWQGCSAPPDLGGASRDVRLPPVPVAEVPRVTTPAVMRPKLDPAWLENARVANFTAWVDIEPDELAAFIERSRQQQISVLEIDLALYHYEPPDVLDRKVKLLDQVARAAHRAGMRCVSYDAAGETITEKATERPHSMSRDHGDWLQVGLDGTPVTFTGGGIVSWVQEGDESAWMCPTSGYADYFLERARRVAETAVDGLWIDVPLFPDEVTPLPCTNASCAALFARETGLAIPRLPRGTPFGPALFDDPVFRRWIRWRHEVLHRWQLRIKEAVEKVRPDCEVIVETVTCDHNRATRYGLDAGFADESRLYRVFEVSPVSDELAMREGWADDWLSLVAMMRYARGAAAPRPAWAFTYGCQPSDAEYVMGIAINAGVCPFECKIPDMTRTVDPAYRTRAFQFIAENRDIYAAQDVPRVAVVHSSASRDFLDRNLGQGIHLSEGDGFAETDSVARLPYMGDYRGCCRALVHAHVPYTILTEFQLTRERLSAYRMVVLPSAVALSEEAIEALRRFVADGGIALVTGSDGGSYTLLGDRRPGPRLLEALGLQPAPDWQTVAHGRGTVLHHPQRAGVQYLTTDDPAILDRFARTAEQVGARILSSAPRTTLMDLRRSKDGTRLYLFCTSLEGLGSKTAGQFAPRPVSCSVRFRLDGLVPTRVVATSLTAGQPRYEVRFTVEGDEIAFQLADVRALVVATVYG